MFEIANGMTVNAAAFGLATRYFVAPLSVVDVISEPSAPYT